MYASGPGALPYKTRINLTELSVANLTDKDTRQQALIANGWAFHGGDDVGVYVKGPFYWLFHSTVDNTYIAHAMKYAMCAEPFQNEPHCSGSKGNNGIAPLQASVFAMASVFVTLFLAQ